MISLSEAIGSRVRHATDRFLSSDNDGFASYHDGNILTFVPTDDPKLHHGRVVLHNQIVGGLRRAFGPDFFLSREYTLKIATNEIGAVALLEFQGWYFIHIKVGSAVLRISSEVGANSCAVAVVDPPLPVGLSIDGYVSELCTTIDSNGETTVDAAQRS